MIRLGPFPFPKVDFSFLGIVFWSNLFIGWSCLHGVSKTIFLVHRLARALPLNKGSLDGFSDKVNLLLRLLPFLFLGRKQGCLLRGFLLYFYGKRLNMDVRLRFGSQWGHGKLKTHCWILQEGVVRFETEDVIRDYVMLLEYS